MEPKPRPVGQMLEYAPVRKYPRMRRWVKPALYLLVLISISTGAWRGWKWRLAVDEKAFKERTAIPWNGWIVFFKPPNAASLRHLSRLPGPLQVDFLFADPSDGSALREFKDRRWPNIVKLHFAKQFAVDPWLKELARPDSGLKALTTLHLVDTKITDSGLNELARPDSGLKSLTTVNLFDTKVTDAGVAELQKARPGLKIYH